MLILVADETPGGWSPFQTLTWRDPVNRAQAANLAIRRGYCYSNRFGMNI
jgi:hypothetical protein